MKVEEAPNPLAEGLHDYRIADPAVMVIFGATGDLSGRKLLPALYNLAKQRSLPAGFAVVGAAMNEMTDVAFRKHASDKIHQFSRTQPIDGRVLDAFLSSLSYVKVDFAQLGDFKALAQKLQQLDDANHIPGNRIFYCATPPPTYQTIALHLHASDLNKGSGFHRIVVEKPFGSDLQSARELTQTLQKVFAEDSVYRIDHYLGKETVQNILAFRFANSIFEPVWNSNLIDSVQITVAEEIGIEQRGAYYDKAGALRDIIQNHGLQLVTLTAMEPPLAFEAGAVRDEKVKVLRAIRPLIGEDIEQSTVRGQYASGWVLGEQVHGYREEKNVAPDSQTETFAALRLFVDNWRWAGVPFYIRTGKLLPVTQTEMRLVFRRPPKLGYAERGNSSPEPNQLVMKLDPSTGVRIVLDAHRADATRVAPITLDMEFGAEGGEGPTPYEVLLHAAMQGDSTRFTRQDCVEETWRVMQPLLDDPPPVHPYAPGSWGPKAADDLIAGHGRWHAPWVAS